MAESFDLNNQPRAADAVAQIPTSASEVAVRTLASDLEAMGQSGGMVSPVAPPTVQVPVEIHGTVPAAPAASSLPRSRIIIITVASVLGAIVLFLIGFFLIGK